METLSDIRLGALFWFGFVCALVKLRFENLERKRQKNIYEKVDKMT